MLRASDHVKPQAAIPCPSLRMAAKKKVRIESTPEGYLVIVGNASKTLPSRTLA